MCTNTSHVIEAPVAKSIAARQLTYEKQITKIVTDTLRNDIISHGQK